MKRRLWPIVYLVLIVGVPIFLISLHAWAPLTMTLASFAYFGPPRVLRWYRGWRGWEDADLDAFSPAPQPLAPATRHSAPAPLTPSSLKAGLPSVTEATVSAQPRPRQGRSRTVRLPRLEGPEAEAVKWVAVGVSCAVVLAGLGWLDGASTEAGWTTAQDGAHTMTLFTGFQLVYWHQRKRKAGEGWEPEIPVRAQLGLLIPAICGMYLSGMVLEVLNGVVGMR